MAAEDVIARLQQVPLFSALSRTQLSELAAIVQRRHFPQGTTVVRQGELGTTMFIVHSGEVVALALDEKGEQMPPRFFQAGASWGETSLLVGEPRDATMRVKEDAELLYIQKADFDRLVAARPDIWNSLAIRPDVHLKLSAPSFPWLGKGERVEWFGHKHWIVLARSLIAPLSLGTALTVAWLLVGRMLSLEVVGV
ncbi:MAG: cyclic nucleotide-binding domain-containing protein, partial [candidate division WOR-3 bacterium]